VNPTHLSLARFPGPPTIHPSGDTAVVPVGRIDLEVDDYTTQLWLVPLDGSPSRQLTYGWRDGSPAYSPDGSLLAFVRAERGSDGKVGRPQIWVLPTAGGEPRKLTDHKVGADAPAWSPDSSRLAYAVREAEEGRYGTVEGTGPEKEAPRRITHMMYRLDGLGFVGDRPRQIWTVDVTDEAPAPIQVTKDDIDHSDVQWSPIEDLLAFAAAGHEDRRNDLRGDVYVCNVDGTGQRPVTAGGLGAAEPRFTADGTRIIFAGSYVGPNARSGVSLNNSLWSVPVAGNAEPVRITDEEKYNLAGNFSVIADGALFGNEARGAVELLLVPLDGGEPRTLMSGRRQIQAVAGAAGRIVATVADGMHWGEVVVREADGTERVLTDVNAGFRADVPVRPLTEVNATAPDGYPVHGWLVRPDGDGPHPLLLMIHGGPFSQYGWQLFDEAQVYAGAGYAVLFSNPRGSSGYGQAHGRAVVGNVGEVSTTDLMAILDHTLAGFGDLDRDRVGVLGGSHGGFMTTWLAGHEGHRFKAAVSERAVNAIDSFTGSSDIGWFFGDDLYGADLEQQRKQSPLAYVDDISVPMLIIHSEQDWRCPLEQAQRLYVALRNRGKVAEMLIFPGEGHELSRSGLPSHRIARFEAIIDWFGRYLR
jgi:dipeptidyl aminopeptidase/acylaminoacyl peptidase